MRPTTRPCRPLYSVCCLSPLTTTRWPTPRPPPGAPGAGDLPAGPPRLLRRGHPIMAPKIKSCTSIGPASCIESTRLRTAFTTQSTLRPTSPRGPASSSTSCGSGGRASRSPEGRPPTLPGSLPAACSCCSHWVRSRWANSRPTTGFPKTTAFSFSPATAAAHTPLASAGEGPCWPIRGCRASCQRAPPIVPSCRNQKHSTPGPECCLTVLHASRKFRSALRAASSWPRAFAGTKSRAAHTQDAPHSPAQRSWKDSTVNSGRNLKERACSAKRSEPSCTVCGCCEPPWRVAGSTTM
mmetsp:Transcript_20710/g.57279  ORF Transcript_20710/g.57279 Transcript_20710/m.57279 type:complete len:296 (-) Transcript_20710:895-1782(-)